MFPPSMLRDVEVKHHPWFIYGGKARLLFSRGPTYSMRSHAKALKWQEVQDWWHLHGHPSCQSLWFLSAYRKKRNYKRQITARRCIPAKVNLLSHYAHHLPDISQTITLTANECSNAKPSHPTLELELPSVLCYNNLTLALHLLTHTSTQFMDPYTQRATSTKSIQQWG